VDDLLILGRDRKPSPRPWRLAVIAVLVMLALVVIRHLPDKRNTASHGPAPAVSVSAGPVQLAGLGSGAAGLLNHADGITRPALPPALPSPADRSPGTTRHSTGRHDRHNCRDYPIVRAGEITNQDAVDDYCTRGTLQ
jgi:hypothetical protein